MNKRAISLFSLMFLWHCGSEPPKKEEVLRPVVVNQVFATGGQRQRTFSAVARSGLSSRLSFRVSGTIQAFPVKIGDKVSKGQLIAKLDAKDYQLQVDDARASLSQAEAQKRNADSNHNRISGLYENNNVSINEYDASLAAKESAIAKVESITKKLELARSQLSYTELNAPLNGQIAEVMAERNENVAAGQAIAVLNAGSNPEVTFNIPEVLIGEIREGEHVLVHIDALGDASFKATITEVGVAIGGLATTYPVVARLDQVSSAIRQGMAAEVSIEFGNGEGGNRIYIKPKAVLEDQQGQTFVFLAVPSSEAVATVHKRLVQPGELTARGLEIQQGLQEGDYVILAGLRFLREGMSVLMPKKVEEGQP